MERDGAWLSLEDLAPVSLTLVNSGSSTPTVGTQATLDTETPGSAQLYILEVDTTALRAGEGLVLQARKTASQGKPGAVGIMAGGGTTSAALTLAFPSSPAVYANTPLVVAYAAGSTVLTTFSDTRGDTFTTITSATTSIAAALAYTIPSGGSFANDDWLTIQSAFGPYDSLTLAAPSSGSNTIAAATLSGATAAPYGGATTTSSSATPTVTTGASVSSGDLVIGSIVVNSAVLTVTPPAGWVVLGSAVGSSSQIQLMSTLATSTATVTFNPTQNGGGTNRLCVAAFPAASGGSPLARLSCFGPQLQPIKQSFPIPVNAAETIEFDLLQANGTARTFPWKVWQL